MIFMKFTDFALPKEIFQALTKLKFEEPTPIQAKTIPVALEGRDILGSAQTGTGKTAAFGIPLITFLLANPESNALVLTPTRELAAQVAQTLQELTPPSLYGKDVLLIGGAPIVKQLKKLRNFPRLIIGTPGRVNDHLRRGSLKLKKTNFLVLDETDRMLDMGFSVQIDEIVKYLPENKQTLLFSATLPNNIMKITAKYLKDPIRVAIGNSSVPVAKIKQDFMHVKENEKYTHLLNQLEERNGSIIIFSKTKFGAKKMAKLLTREKYKADAIHGDLKHGKREQVIAAFRKSKFRILVATDVAARGLDIPHIEHVINYDLPQCPEDYIHRIGRTARNEAEGSSLSFVTPSDSVKFNLINALINPGSKKPINRKENVSRRRKNNNGKKFYWNNSKKTNNRNFTKKRAS